MKEYYVHVDEEAGYDIEADDIIDVVIWMVNYARETYQWNEGQETFTVTAWREDNGVRVEDYQGEFEVPAY